MKTVSELVRRAHRDVADAGLEGERVVAAALAAVLQHYLATEPIEGAAVPTERAMVPVQVDAATPVSEAGIVAGALGIPLEAVETVFVIGEDTVSLEIPVSHLPETKAAAARDVTIVIAAVNNALDRETRTSAIRSILDEYGRFDSGNFMTEIRRVPQEHLAIKGKPNTRDHLLMIRRPGMEEAARIIRKWSGLPPEE